MTVFITYDCYNDGLTPTEEQENAAASTLLPELEKLTNFESKVPAAFVLILLR